MIQQLSTFGDKSGPERAENPESRRVSWSRWLAAGPLTVILLVAPLPFASVLPRDRSLVAGLAFLACAVALANARQRPPGGGVGLALAAVGLYGLAQSVAWPALVSDLVVPAGAAAWRASDTLLGADRGGVALSLAPAVSRSAALLWLAAAAALVSAALVSADRRLRRLLVLSFCAVTVLEIVYGADAWFEGRAEIWGRELKGGAERLRGTFVNPDHLAMFLVMGLAVTFAWGLWASRRALRGGRLEARLSFLLPPWLLFLMVFVALAFTGSRAGFLGGLLALVAQSALLIVERRRWQAALWGLGSLALGMGGLLYLGSERGLSRFLGTTVYEITWNARLEVYRASLDLWWDFFWTGTGLGTFRQAFPRVQPADLPLEWIHAHSDVLEIFVTTGLIGPLFLATGTVLLWRLWIKNLRRGRRSEDRAMVLAAAGAWAGTLGHSLVDFGLTMPANALSLAILVGLACGVPTAEPDAADRTPEAAR